MWKRCGEKPLSMSCQASLRYSSVNIRFKTIDLLRLNYIFLFNESKQNFHIISNKCIFLDSCGRNYTLQYNIISVKIKSVQLR